MQNTIIENFQIFYIILLGGSGFKKNHLYNATPTLINKHGVNNHYDIVHVVFEHYEPISG